MRPALPLARPDDHRLVTAVEVGLRTCRLDPEWAPTISRLATGDIPASTLHCCGSGCRPCVADLVRCTRLVLEALQQDEVAPGQGDPSGGFETGVSGFEGDGRGPVRRLARSILSRLVGRSR